MSEQKDRNRETMPPTREEIIGVRTEYEACHEDHERADRERDAAEALLREVARSSHDKDSYRDYWWYRLAGSIHDKLAKYRGGDATDARPPKRG